MNLVFIVTETLKNHKEKFNVVFSTNKLPMINFIILSNSLIYVIGTLSPGNFRENDLETFNFLITIS